MLAARCMQHGDYDRAEELLDQLTDKPAVDKNHMKANLFVKLGRLDEAAQILERKLMAAASDVQSALLALMTLALNENDMETAGYLAEVSQKSSRLLESWEYNSYVAAFELAAAKKDGDTCMEMLTGMADALKKPWLFSQSRLYRHVPQKIPQNKSDLSEILPGLLASIKSDEDMECLKNRTDFDSFAAVIRKYVGIRELTPTIVNEFVKKIIVHAPDKSSGHRRQKIEIIWNFIGELEQDEDKQTIERQRKSRTA